MANLKNLIVLGNSRFIGDIAGANITANCIQGKLATTAAPTGVTIGNATTPVFFNQGVPTACTLQASISVATNATNAEKLLLVGTPTNVTNSLKRYGVTGPYITGTELFAGSDIRFKENIAPISDEFVDKLFEYDNIIYNFDWKESNKNSDGFIAQYLQEYIPEAVDGEDYLYVNYNAALSKTVGALFKKIKQQDKEIAELKQIVNELKEKQ